MFLVVYQSARIPRVLGLVFTSTLQQMKREVNDLFRWSYPIILYLTPSTVDTFSQLLTTGHSDIELESLSLWITKRFHQKSGVYAKIKFVRIIRYKTYILQFVPILIGIKITSPS